MPPPLDPAKISELVASLRGAVQDVIPPEEPDILRNDEICIRFLKSRNWELQPTIRMLHKSLVWRAEYRPQLVTCQACCTHPGCHSLRQVGFDEAGRPVIYACFYQSTPQRNMAAEAITHLIYVIENAVRSMRPGVSQWVFVMDCSGMTSGGCNPRVGYECAQLMSNHYPERLGLAICINPGPVFKVVWQSVKPFLPATTSSKVHLTKNLAQLKSCLDQHFSPELATWILAEYELNRLKPKSLRYRQFWMPTSTAPGSHDPRGEKEYTDNWIRLDHPTGHLPHPNMIDVLNGKLTGTVGMHLNGEPEDDEVDGDGESENGDEEVATRHILDTMPREFQIPKNATPLS